MSKRTKKKNSLLLLLILLLIGISVGFAAFAQNLYITGTASASGNFELEFSDSSYVKEHSSKDGTTGSINYTTPGNKDSLTFNAKLAQPNSIAEFNAHIGNTGTIDAKLDAVTITSGASTSNLTSGQSVTFGDYIITCSFSDAKIPGQTSLEAPLVLSIKWNESTPQTATPEELSFTITLKYSQDSSNATVPNSTVTQ